MRGVVAAVAMAATVVAAPGAGAGVIRGLGAPLPHHLQLGANLSTTAPARGPVVRADVCWECVQPVPGAWDWSHDNAMKRMLGKRWQPILDYAPLWASAPPGTYVPPPHPSAPAPGPAPKVAILHKPPLRVAAFARFAAAFVARYHPHVIEVWNEPDIYVYWNAPGAARSYGRLFAATYRAIKRVAPATLVLAGGLDESNGRWSIPAMAPALGHVHPDGWSVHPYAATVSGMQQLLAMNKRLLRRYRIMAPFYVTEFGCWSATPCPAGSVFRRHALAALALDPDVVQADWWGNLP
jgi:hypothetical protein